MAPSYREKDGLQFYGSFCLRVGTGFSRKTQKSKKATEIRNQNFSVRQVPARVFQACVN